MANIVSVEVSCHPAGVHKTGQIYGGTLTIRGVLRKAPRFGSTEEKHFSGLGVLENDGPYCRLYPDCAISLSKKVEMFLLPLCRIMTQDWNHKDPDPLKNPWTQKVLGLAVLRLPGGDFTNVLASFTSLVVRCPSSMARIVLMGLKSKSYLSNSFEGGGHGCSGG
jgi:hypothetical protein